MEIEWLHILMIILLLVVGFHLINLIFPPKRTKYANGELFKLLNNLPISKIIKAIGNRFKKK